jgi:hypothetical protein
MVTDTNKKPSSEKLADNDPLSLRSMTPPKKPSTKKRIRRISEPYIRKKRIKGNEYYYYVEGAEERYLGTADSILAAVTNFRAEQRRQL